MKKTAIRIGFILLLIGTFYIVSTILKVKSPHGINQSDCFYWQPENTIDVVMMGSSHIHCNINNGLLWEKYGIASYDYSSAEQPLWMTYYYLKELYKYQNPKVIILDLYSPAHFKEDYQYTWLSENIYGMRFSLNKLEMLSVSIEPGRLPEYFPSFVVYHSRYDDLEADDFQRFFWDEEEMESFKGYTPYLEREPQTRPVISEKRADGLTEKSLKYLMKIINYTKEKDTTLILIATPYITTNEDTRTFNQVAEIARENGLTFINYNEYYDEIGLDFENDFNDDSHLNYWGSCKFTEFLGDFLSSCPAFSDHRDEEGYESWDENAQIIKNYVKKASS